jgi:hypothetical protein
MIKKNSKKISEIKERVQDVVAEENAGKDAEEGDVIKT